MMTMMTTTMMMMAATGRGTGARSSAAAATERASRSPAADPARVIRGICRRDIFELLWRGYDRFHGTFLPSLRALERQDGRSQRALLAKAHLLAGEICFWREAPAAAARAYRRSLRHAPRQVDAWDSLAGVLTLQGRYRAAAAAARRAVALSPDDDLVRAELEDAIEGARMGKPAELSPGDPLVQANEALANGQPRQALSRLGRARTAPARLVRARAFGALHDSESAIAQWQSLATDRPALRLEWADWFHIDDQTWDSPRFWQALLTLLPALLPGVQPGYDSLERALGDNPGRGFDPRRWRRQSRLVFRYNLARTRGDVRSLEALAREVPRWSLPRETLEQMRR
jgi:tetratricopeptide (TPR) repeat protein